MNGTTINRKETIVKVHAYYAKNLSICLDCNKRQLQRLKCSHTICRSCFNNFRGANLDCTTCLQERTILFGRFEASAFESALAFHQREFVSIMDQGFSEQAAGGPNRNTSRNGSRNVSESSSTVSSQASPGRSAFGGEGRVYSSPTGQMITPNGSQRNSPQNGMETHQNGLLGTSPPVLYARSSPPNGHVQESLHNGLMNTYPLANGHPTRGQNGFANTYPLNGAIARNFGNGFRSGSPSGFIRTSPPTVSPEMLQLYQNGLAQLADNRSRHSSSNGQRRNSSELLPINGNLNISSGDDVFQATNGDLANLLPQHLPMPKLLVPPQNESPRYCGGCMIGHLAQFHCINCAEDLCHNCENYHRTHPATRAHKIINIRGVVPNNSCDDAAISDDNQISLSQLDLALARFGIPPQENLPSNAEETDALEGVPCLIHEGEWALSFCSTCNEPICRRCNPHHAGHDTKRLRESCDNMRSGIKNLLAEAKSRAKSFDQSGAKVAAVRDAVQRNMHLTIEKIKTDIDNYKAHLDERCSSLISTTTLISQVKTNVTENQLQILSQGRSQLEEIIMRIEPSIESLNYMDLVKSYQDVTGALANVRDVCNFLQPQVIDRLDYRPYNFHDSEPDVERFNTGTFADHTYAIGHGIETAMQLSVASFKIITKGVCGAPVYSGGEKLLIYLRNPATQTCQPIRPRDLGNGSYLVEYLPPELPGEYKIDVRLMGRHIRGSPFTVNVRRRPNYSSIRGPFLTVRSGSQRDLTFNKPWGICIDKLGFIYIADRASHKVRVLDHKGILQYSFGKFGAQPGQFNRPCAVEIDTKGRLLIVDKDNHRVAVYTKDGTFLSTFGHRGSQNGEFNYPWAIACDPADGRIAVSDTRNHKVQVFDAETKFMFSVGGLGGTLHYKLLDSPRAVCFGRDGTLYVSDFNHHRVYAFPKHNRSYYGFGESGNSEGNFCRPQGIFVDNNNNVLVCDSKNHRIQVFSPSGKFLAKFGTRELSGLDMDRPCDLKIGTDGKIVIMDSNSEVLYFF